MSKCYLTYKLKEMYSSKCEKYAKLENLKVIIVKVNINSLHFLC